MNNDEHIVIRNGKAYREVTTNEAHESLVRLVHDELAEMTVAEANAMAQAATFLVNNTGNKYAEAALDIMSCPDELASLVYWIEVRNRVKEHEWMSLGYFAEELTPVPFRTRRTRMKIMRLISAAMYGTWTCVRLAWNDLIRGWRNE